MHWTPRAVFTTLHFLPKLRTGPISYRVNYSRLNMRVRKKHSSLFDPFVNYIKLRGVNKLDRLSFASFVLFGLARDKRASLFVQRFSCDKKKF
jgi:hypothetical protein